MVDGISILPKTALAILKYFENELLEKDSFEILEFFNNLKSMEIDTNRLLQLVSFKKPRRKTMNKIFPFTHPTTNLIHSQSFDDGNLLEPTSPAKVMVNCEITEDPMELPFEKNSKISRKSYKYVKYRSSFTIEQNVDGSTIAEDSKVEENFDATVILHDLITEDFE